MSSKRPTKIITIPTKQRRHSTEIRFGKISHEVFCRDPKRRRELGLPLRYMEE